ncbi:MAG: (2Fe-2S)-binding protein, partial [Pseudomonadota bacterium]
ARGLTRLAFHEGGTLAAALFIAPRPVAVMRDYLATEPGQPAKGILSGRAPADVPDPGATLCACFSVGVNTIARAVEARGLASVEEVGNCLRAGTNCGSCRSEIATLLAEMARPQAAE